jgi:hypothetical protein
VLQKSLQDECLGSLTYRVPVFIDVSTVDNALHGQVFSAALGSVKYPLGSTGLRRKCELRNIIMRVNEENI